MYIMLNSISGIGSIACRTAEQIPFAPPIAMQTVAMQNSANRCPVPPNIWTLPIYRLCRSLAVSATLTLSFAGAAYAQSAALPVSTPTATALLEKHVALTAQLSQNHFARPLVIDSYESATAVSGSAYAVIDSPFNTVSSAFKSPNQWCEVMILHINTKYCRANSDASPGMLKVNIGKKTPQQLKDAFALEFAMRVASATPGYLAVQVNADKGPLGTSNYRIELQAVPLPDGKTFMHLRYSYGFGVVARMAMQAYLSTVASDKVGFTPLNTGKKSDYVGGMRGTVERNTMRYYLAIEAYLASLGKAQPKQFNARLEHWFDATEQYPLQLHEVDKSSYLLMKKSEYQRQQAGSSG